ncbi:MAG: DNA translocase FtsK 4TM domain-containing protein [Nitrospiraceae bacterium]
MGGATTTKRGDTRGPSHPPTHLKHEVIGVLLITLSLLTLLSLVSFVPTDASLLGSPASGSAPAGQAHNMIGAVGATLAAFLFGLVGGGAYLLSGLLAMLGARCFVEGELAVTIRSAAGSFAALLFLSGLLHLEVTAIPTLSSGFVYRGMAGGRVGQAMAEGLREYFASTGAHIIVLAGLIISLLLATPMSLADLGRRLSEWWISSSEFVTLRLPAWWERTKETVAALLPERLADESAKVKKAKPRPLKINRPEPVAAPSPVEEPVPGPEPEPEPTAAMAGPEPSPAVEPVVKETRKKTKKAEVVMARAAAEGYVLPDPLELLSDPSGPIDRLTDEQIKAQSEVLTKALLNFGIEGKVTEVHPGPVVTMYEFEPAPGVKVAWIVSLADDLALAMKAISLRIVAPLPGKSVVGVEVPNPSRETVALKEVVTSEAFTKSRSKLRLAMGKDIFGKPAAADLKTMPHLLVAGATGAGKSVALNTMLMSILFTAKPDEVKFLLVDPKMLEFKAYDGLPHLLRPVITDAKSAARGLGWVVQEMERRYKLLAEAGVRNVDDYNRRVAKEQGVLPKEAPEVKPTQADLPIEFLSEDARLAAGESTVSEGPKPVAEPKTPPSPLPYIVVMIDELADLMAVAPKEVEEKIARLAQMARASGIHLILATQRPSVDVLTGLIKANFPARIAFQVSSKTDSRTILDANGAEALLGRGDLLYLASGTGKIVRLHGSFVPDDDVHRVVEFVKKQASPVYSEELRSLRQEEAKEEEEGQDEVYEQAKELVISSGQASASLIQRRLRVGYPRAARMIEQMEQEGIVGAPGRDGRREVLVRRGTAGEELDA